MSIKNVRVGDLVSFVYDNGKRAGQRRFFLVNSNSSSQLGGYDFDAAEFRRATDYYISDLKFHNYETRPTKSPLEVKGNQVCYYNTNDSKLYVIDRAGTLNNTKVVMNIVQSSNLGYVGGRAATVHDTAVSIKNSKGQSLVVSFNNSVMGLLMVGTDGRYGETVKSATPFDLQRMLNETLKDER